MAAAVVLDARRAPINVMILAGFVISVGVISLGSLRVRRAIVVPAFRQGWRPAGLRGGNAGDRLMGPGLGRRATNGLRARRVALRRRTVSVATAGVLLLAAWACTSEPVPTAPSPAPSHTEALTAEVPGDGFADATTLDNEWFPLKPGTQFGPFSYSQGWAPAVEFTDPPGSSRRAPRRASVPAATRTCSSSASSTPMSRTPCS